MKNQLLHWPVWTLLILITLTSSCSLFDPDEPVPAYIHIEPWTVTTTAGQGTSQQRITDAWVAVNDELVGAFFLPVTIPVLADGPADIVILPGIIENGISTTRQVYPFFENAEFTRTLVPLNIDTLRPQSAYRANTTFVFVEDFEGSNIFGQDLDGNSNTILNISSTETFEGNASGRFSFIGNSALGEVATSVLFDLPRQDSPIYLELHFKSEIEFTVGVLGTYANGTSRRAPKLTLTPRDDWRKVYVNVQPEVQSLGARDYQIYFSAFKADEIESANIFFDNIKLIHF